MALLDRKIPILTGINDTPSTTGQPKHPNASLLCKKFNDLIDNELTALQQSVSPPLITSPTTTLESIYLYVDATTGNDTTGDGSNTAPYATIEKAISALPSKIHFCSINLTGAFTNPNLDFSKVTSIISQVNVGYNSYFAYFSAIQLNGGTIIFNDNFDNVDYANSNNRKSLVYSPNCPISFSNTTLQFTGNDCSVLHDTTCYFNGCTFSFPRPSGAYVKYGLILTEGYNMFNSCTFTLDDATTWALFGLNKTTLVYDNCTLTKDNSTAPYPFAEGSYSTVKIDLGAGVTPNIDCSGLYFNTVFLKLYSGIVVGDYNLSTNFNLVQEVA